MAQSSTTHLDTTATEALRAEIDTIPDEVDGIDLKKVKLDAAIALDQALTALRVLRKLSA